MTTSGIACKLRRFHHSKALGHAPIIDRNYRAQHEAKAEWAKEVERMKLIHMPDPDDRLFDFRMAERVNARPKDEFGARVVRVRGAIKSHRTPGRRRADSNRRRSQRPRPCILGVPSPA
jgi:hypothetical protein